MTKYLIVNSDDLGISEDVSRGIIEAHLNGIVSSATTMVNMPAAASGIKAAQEQAPKLGLGLHLTLSFGKPVLPAQDVPSLVTDAGTFVSDYAGLMAKLPVYTAKDLEAELNAQFDKFVELAGRKPTHIDSHHRGAYMHPAAFEVMMSLAEKHSLPFRRPVWLDGNNYDDVPLNTDGKLAEQLRAIWEKHGKPTCPDTMTSIFIWETGSRVGMTREIIENLQNGYTELICHVGYGADLEEDFNVQRDDDLAAMLDPSIVALVNDDPDIQLVTFADMVS